MPRGRGQRPWERQLLSHGFEQSLHLLHRRMHPQSLVGTHVVVNIHCLGHKAFHFLKAFVFCVKQPAVLDRVVHPFCQGIMQGIACLSHADPDAVSLEKVNVLVAAVLHATVGVVDERAEVHAMLPVEVHGTANGLQGTSLGQRGMKVPTDDQACRGIGHQ